MPQEVRQPHEMQHRRIHFGPPFLLKHASLRISFIAQCLRVIPCLVIIFFANPVGHAFCSGQGHHGHVRVMRRILWLNQMHAHCSRFGRGPSQIESIYKLYDFVPSPEQRPSIHVSPLLQHSLSPRMEGLVSPAVVEWVSIKITLTDISEPLPTVGNIDLLVLSSTGLFAPHHFSTHSVVTPLSITGRGIMPSEVEPMSVLCFGNLLDLVSVKQHDLRPDRRYAWFTTGPTSRWHQHQDWRRDR